MALIELSNIVCQPLERQMGKGTTVDHGITYVEKGTALIADNATGFYIPTKLQYITSLQFTPMSAEFYTATPYVTSLSPVISEGVCQASTTTKVRLADAETFGDDDLNGLWMIVKQPDGVEELVQITDYTATGDYADVTPALSEAPGTTTTYKILGITATCADPGTGGAEFGWRIEGRLQ